MDGCDRQRGLIAGILAMLPWLMFRLDALGTGCANRGELGSPSARNRVSYRSTVKGNVGAKSLTCIGCDHCR